mgnify:CR=1 FL=1
MKNSVINTYLIKEFLIGIGNVVLVFSAGGLIMNLREEVTYFADYDVGIMLPIALSFMVVPSILVNIFPFIIFLSSMWVLIKLKNSNEILSLKTFGFSSARFVTLFGATAFFSGVIILLAVSPVTSLMVKYYEDVKGGYDLDKSHLASITNNGVWLKEKGREPESPRPSQLATAAIGTIDSERVANPEGESLTGLVPYIACVEVSVHARRERSAVESLHPIRDIGDKEPCIRVSQIVVHSPPFRDCAIRPKSIDVVVSGANTQFRI